MPSLPYQENFKGELKMSSISISYNKIQLSNGLDVITHVDKSMPMVSVNLWYHVGSKNESPGKTGFAHLFEHIMFEGSKNHNKDYFEPLQKIGANVNGSTTNDRTNYWEDVPSNNLDLALWLESDRMGFLLDALDNDRFDLQREVVKNERRQSYENRPYGMAYLKLQEALFPSPHPYNWPTIGSQKDLEAADLEDVKSFFKKYYKPSNASLSIAGDIDPEHVVKQVEKYFGDLPPGNSIERMYRTGSSLKGQTVMEYVDQVQLPRLYLAWPTPPDFTHEQAALDMLSIILSDGKSSRLHKSMVYETQKALDVQAFNHGQEISGEFHVIATANPDVSLTSLESMIKNQLESIRQNGPTQSELDRAINRLQSYQIRQLEKIGGFGGKADQLNYYNVLGGDADLINSDIERYKKVEPEDVAMAASLLGENHVMLSVTPQKNLSNNQKKIDRSKEPKSNSSVSFSPPSPQEHIFEDGTRLIVVERDNLPLTSFGIIIDSGSAQDPPKHPGLAKFTVDMLVEGTNKRTSMEISDEMEFLGAHIQKDVAREYLVLSVDGLSDHIGQEVEILADVFNNPTFPQQEFERIQKERISELTASTDNADFIADIASQAILYGSDSSYGHPSSGTIKSISEISLDEIRHHYKKYLLSAPKTFLAVGKINITDVKKLITKHFQPEAKKINTFNTNILYNPKPKEKTTVYLVDRPGSAQSVIRAGHLTIPRFHQDYYAFSFLNYVLGGDYSGRLNLNLRQDKGYSYGFYSRISWNSISSSWQSKGSVQTEVTGNAIREIISEINGLKSDNPVSENEFNHAKNGLLSGVPAQFETNKQIMTQLINMSVFKLPLNYFQASIERLQKLEINDVLTSAEKHVDVENISIVVIGDREIVEPQLHDLELPLAHVDIYGTRISKE